MSRGINKVILIGNLGSDPEIKISASGSTIANFTLATNERWKNSEGVQQEQTEWHRVVAFGRLAEICGEYLRKGRQVYIEGRLQTRSWEDKEGTKRYTTEIVLRDMQMLGTKGETVMEDIPSSPPTQQQDKASTEEDDLPF